MRVSGVWRVVVACTGVALLVGGCNTRDGVFLREGAGIDLFSQTLPEQTQLQEAYVGYICQQAGLSSTVLADGSLVCGLSGFSPAQWSVFVQSGMNDIDQRCDAYLGWLDDKKRSSGPILQQLSDMRTATEAIMVATGATGPYPIGIVGAAFGLATRTFTNVNSRLVLELNHSTVQSVVLTRQRKYRQQLLGNSASGAPAIPILNRPAAIHALRSYLRLCMPFTIETEINTTITDIERAGIAGLLNNQPLINAETVRTGIITDPNAPMSRPAKFGPAPSNDHREGPIENALQRGEIIQFQQVACVSPANGRLGQRGSATRLAIKSFLVKRRLKDATENDVITDNNRIDLKDEISKITKSGRIPLGEAIVAEKICTSTNG